MANGNWMIRKGDPVYDETDDKLGSIDKVENGYFKMDTGLLGLGETYYVPESAIADVRDGGVYLLTTKERLACMGWEEPPAEPAPASDMYGEPRPHGRTHDAMPGAAPRGHEYRETSAAGGRRTYSASEQGQLRRQWGNRDACAKDAAPEGSERGDEAGGLAPGPDAATYEGTASNEYDVDPKGSPPRGK